MRRETNTRSGALWLVVALVMAPHSAGGQQPANQSEFGVVTGAVRDSEQQHPIRGATVMVVRGADLRIQGTTRGARTDSLGRFRIDSVLPGTVTILVRGIGYRASSDTGVLIRAGKAAHVTLAIAEDRWGPRPTPEALAKDRQDMADSGGDSRSTWPAVGAVAAYPGFSLALVRAVVERAPDSNVFLSPASAGFLLAMTSAGAASSTWTGMAHVLGADPAEQAALGPANAAELSSLAKQSGVELDIANSVWASADRPILKSFVDGSRRWYDAQVSSLVLHGATAEGRINTWVAQATKGKIPGILGDTLPDTTAMVLVNAVYLKGAWRGVFDSTQSKPHPFTLADGSTTSRILMSRRSSFLYTRDTGFQIVRLPYRGGRTAMYVILPDSLAPVTDLTGRLDTAHWGGWMRAMGSRDVHVLLPKFRLSTGRSLGPPLWAMGMAIAFDPVHADFSGILPTGGRPDSNLYLSEVLQKTFLEVNEEGTVAAAAAGGLVTLTAQSVPPPPIEFVVDRPFWLVIRDDKTGLILFMGHIVNPPSD